jgi:hypothetical protein
MRKMDEMEMLITAKSIKWVWLYEMVFLSIWALLDFMFNQSISYPFILLISQLAIFFFLQLFLKWKLSKNEE